MITKRISSNPYNWRKIDVYMWIENFLQIHGRTIYFNEIIPRILHGRMICNLPLDYFYEISHETGMELFEDLQMIITTHDQLKSSFTKITICEFLIEKLKIRSNLIEWMDFSRGVFKILEPFALAKLWGSKSYNKNMNYKKMSRAIRYHYNNEIRRCIKNFVYQFNLNFLKKFEL